MSLGLKNIYLITALFLCTLSGYPVSMIFFRITYKGLEPITDPEATSAGPVSRLSKTSTFEGAKEI